MLQNINPATELPQKEGITFDELSARERALAIGQQIKELNLENRTSPSRQDVTPGSKNYP
jgi:hypothetical protein